jgi:hypothetical protein
VNIADGCNTACGVSDGPALLVISSPHGSGGLSGRPFYDEFKKDAMSLYLEKPTEEEVMLMGKHCFGLRDDDAAGHAAARDRMRRHGPIPRYVWGRIADEETALEQAIEGQEISALRKFVRTKTEAVVVNDISFRVVHFVISADRRSVGYNWATPYVGRRVAEVLQAADTDDSLALLSELLRKKDLRSMSGYLFEDWCNTKMLEGGTFRIRRLGVGGATRAAKVEPLKDVSATDLFKEADAQLDTANIGDDGSGTITFSKAVETVKLAKAGELPAASAFAGKRFRARECFAAADFIEANGIGFNATVEAAHDLTIIGKENTNGLLPIVNHLQPGTTWAADKGTAVPFLWLVPKQVFAECRAGTMQINILPEPKTDASFEQKEAYKVRAALERSARLLAPWVVQYAVEMPDPLGN